MDDGYLIDPERIASKAMVFEGTLLPAGLERLAGSLADGRGELHFKLTARLDRLGRKVVSCIIEGFVFLTCQSSLDAFRHAISIDDRLVLVGSESELPSVEEESDAEDYLVADGPLDIRGLVEDAVLLALPMVPRKPGLEVLRQTREAAPGESPFAALASLTKTDKPT